jgi:uncharacterized damage-inducible protein DinB
MTSITKELEQEAEITSRVLARVPEDKLAWKPHAKSMTLGQLALHTATIPGAMAGILAADSLEVDPATFGQAAQPASLREIMDGFEGSVASAKDFLNGLSNEKAEAIWRLTVGEREMVAVPREWVIRGIMFNHWYHHRGQLSVYLRLLDIPVPKIYGASADENPFAA